MTDHVDRQTDGNVETGDSEIVDRFSVLTNALLTQTDFIADIPKWTNKNMAEMISLMGDSELVNILETNKSLVNKILKLQRLLLGLGEE